MISRQPPKAGETMRHPILAGLFINLIDWNILRDNLLFGIERLSLELMKQRGISEDTVKRYIRNLRFIETRNLFAHGKEILLPIRLSHLLPDSEDSLSSYGIEWD